MLSERDRRVLAEIEAWFRCDDPGWAANFDVALRALRSIRSPRGRAWTKTVVVAVVVGVVSMLVGLASLALACAVVALVAWTVPRLGGGNAVAVRRRRF